MAAEEAKIRSAPFPRPGRRHSDADGAGDRRDGLRRRRRRRRALSINDPRPGDEDGRATAAAGCMLVWLGLFGLVASFHGIIGLLAADLLLARAGYLPAGLASSTAARAPRIWRSCRGVVGSPRSSPTR